MMFKTLPWTTTTFALMLLQSVSAHATDSSSKLRGFRRDSPPDLMEVMVLPPFPQTTTQHSDDDDEKEEQERRMVEAKTLTLINNCGTDIKLFRGMYNAQWVYDQAANSYTFDYKSTGQISIAKGNTATIPSVSERTVHFYGLNSSYNWQQNKWNITEVARGTSPSNVFTPVVFTAGTERYEFTFWMATIGDDMKLNLCSMSTTSSTATSTLPSTTTPTTRSASTTTTTSATTTTTMATTKTRPVSTTVAATTTTAMATTTRPNTITTTRATTPTTTTTTTRPTTTTVGSGSTVTIVNKCGVDIAYMEIRYNFYWNEHEQYASDKTGGVSLVSDGSLTLPTRNTGTMIHVYGWYDAAETAVSGPTTRTYDYRDVFATAGYDFSQYWTHATLTLPTGSTIRFPFYQIEIGADNVVELCESD